jgi:hypothetical protein
MTQRSLVWFRGKELRVADHAPLAAAARDGEAIPVFVLYPYFLVPARARDMPYRIHEQESAIARIIDLTRVERRQRSVPVAMAPPATTMARRACPAPTRRPNPWRHELPSSSRRWLDC